jgi:aerobic C4-dicarboxylate transport protein
LGSRAELSAYKIWWPGTATLSVIPTISVAVVTLIFGIDRFLSKFRAVVSMIGNGVATLVLARWERELKSGTLRQHLARPAWNPDPGLP